MAKQTFALSMPDAVTTGVVFASPHSGREYPWSFLRRSVLNERTIRSSEDAFVDQLFEDAPKYGAPLIAATAPRAFIDLNRSADELDPALIQGVRTSVHNPRVMSGLGVVPRVVSNGRAIYRGKMSRKDAEARIDTYWRPYHVALDELMSQAQASYGKAILIDCHSMPHEALENVNYASGQRPDVVLGDRFGAAASSDIVEAVEAALSAAGFKVIRNAPFAGAFTTQHYGRPSSGRHAIQVEIDRSLYMNERMIRPNGNFNSVRKALAKAMEEIVQLGRPSLPLAAE